MLNLFYVLFRCFGLLVFMFGLSGCYFSEQAIVLKTVSLTTSDEENLIAEMLVKDSDEGHARKLICEFPLNYDSAKVWTAKAIKVSDKDGRNLCVVVEYDQARYEKRVGLVEKVEKLIKAEEIQKR